MSKQQSLLDTFGGSDGIHEMAFGFHQRVVRDVHLRRYFRHQDIDIFVVLHQEFFEIALGRSITKDKEILKNVLDSFPLEQKEFPRFIRHIIDTLEQNGLNKSDIPGVTDRIANYIETLTGLPCKNSLKTNNYNTFENTPKSEGNYEGSCI